MFKKSDKLHNVCYDIRGPVHDEAQRLEEDGHRILKLNIGNPAPFGFEAPDEIVRDVIHNLPQAQGYCDSKGLFSARKAVFHHYQEIIPNIDVEDIYIGNGVSELIQMATMALLNNNDEVLVPAPDYPLWTASVNLAGGKAVHYRCDEQANWFPDIDDIRSKVSKNTKAIVLINPNNPTGAVYTKEIIEQLLQVAREFNLMVFSDEIYDKILFDEATHVHTASLAEDVVIVTFNGLSKAYRIAGFRAGWMVISGNKELAAGYITGLNMLASMRLCANVPCQHAIQTALGGYQSINELILPGGRLLEQRDACYDILTSIDGVSCVKPKGAMYMFPKLDVKKFNLKDDQQLVFDLLKKEKILLVHGTAFNWPEPDHLRIVTLPYVQDLTAAMQRFGQFLENYRQ